MTAADLAAEIAYGWTLEDAERIAGRAARDHPSRLLDFADRREAALGAVTEAILTTDEPPSLPALLRAASDAVSRQADAERRERGLSARDHASTAPRFARYWYQPSLPFDEAVVEHIAVHQVMAGIRPSWRRDLETLAETGSYEAAAEVLGTTAVTFRSRISKARAAAAALWFEPDAAPGMWGSDRRGGTAERSATRCIRSRARDRAAAAEASRAA